MPQTRRHGGVQPGRGSHASGRGVSDTLIQHESGDDVQVRGAWCYTSSKEVEVSSATIIGIF